MSLLQSATARKLYRTENHNFKSTKFYVALNTEMDFWRQAAGTSRLIQVRNEAIREKWGNTNNFGENGKQHVEMVWTRSTHAG